MEMTEIKRSVPSLPSLGDATQQLAAEAETLLGYGVLRQGIASGNILPPLSRVCAELEIEILNTADVDAYQRETWEKQAKEDWAKWIADESKWDNDWRKYSWYLEFRTKTWGEHPLAEYKQPIPVHVLNKAVQIKKACPEVEFFVEALEEMPDPFLVAKAGVERLYLEVWDEPVFESRRA